MREYFDPIRYLNQNFKGLMKEVFSEVLISY